MDESRNELPVGRASRPTALPPCPALGEKSGVNPDLHQTPLRSADANPSFGYRELRRGRTSFPGANYFLTICLQRPASGLAACSVAPSLFAELDRLHTEGAWRLRSAVIMPDHLHLVITLGTSELSDTVRLFKGRTASSIRTNRLHWQPSFFDHRLRSSDELPSIFRYILLNPYRSRLLPFTEAWPAYRCCPEDWAWFEPTTNNGLPWPEWADADPPVPGASAWETMSPVSRA